MKKIISVLISVLVLLSAVLTVSAEEESRVVRVACGMNDTLYLNDAGEPAGLCLTYVRQLAWNMNWTIEYVEGSYNESIQNLIDGKVDIMFPVSKEDDPDGKLLFSEYIGGYQQIGLFAKEGADIYYDDYEGFDGCSVGISIGSNSEILDSYAKEHGFSYLAKPLNSIQDKVNALNNGDVDLIAFSTLNAVENGKLVAVLDQVPVYFATSADKPELMDEINKSMSISMTNIPEEVADMYQSVMKGSNVISFTKEENDKIQSTDKVVFGVYSDSLPLAGINSKGECVGIYVDALKEIAKESGLNIEIKPVADSNKLYSYMDDGTVDFVISLQELRFYSENADNYLASVGIGDYTTVAVTMPDYSFEDESPVFALTKARNFLEDYIHENFPKAVIEYYDTRKECLDAVQSGTANATFLNTWEFNYETKNPRFQDMMEWESMRISSVFGLGGTKNSDLELLSILEKTIGQLSSERISDIIASNINMPYDSYDFADRFYEFKNVILIAGIVILFLVICFIVYLKVRKKYINDLVIANRVKSDFLSRMSHELRTPLNAINGYASITAESLGSDDELNKAEIAENMSSIRKASDFLLGIITDILDVQRMDTGKIVLEKSEIQPKEYMNSIVKMIKPMADEKHIDFSYNMISGGEDNYVLDGLRVQQVLFNILYNAVKFTPDGGKVTMNSEIIAKDDVYSTIKFVIADTGIGMSKEFLETKLFQRFAQENQDISSPYSGCGNGLAISKKLVSLMDGDISCESEQGKGTVFTVTVKAEHRAQEKQKRRRRETQNYDLGGVKVLMCEDNQMNQEIERRILERMHCEVEIAADGKIGLDKFSESPENYYSVILMDIRMPNMDGLEATRAIRSLERSDAKSIPVIAVSANAFDEDIKKSMDAGMNEHLAKPVSAKILYEKIKEHCGL